MKKLLIFTTLMVLAFAMIANGYANFTRVQTLGNNNDVLLDPNNIFDYVSRVNDYPKWAIADFGDFYDEEDYESDFHTFGVLWQFGSQENPWVLGTFFHDASQWEASNDADWSSYWGGWDPTPFNPGSNKRIDLFYGRKLGTTPFGFHLGYVSAGEEYKASQDTLYNWYTSNYEEKMRNLSVSLGITLPGQNIDLSAGFAKLSWTDKAYMNTSGGYVYTEMTKPSGGTSFWLRGRKFIAAWPNSEFTFVPHAMFSSAKIGIERYDNDNNVDLDITDTHKRFGLRAGAGLQWNPNPDATCLIDFGFDYDKITWDYENLNDTSGFSNSNGTEKITSLPYFKLGAEGKVFDWLWARLGSTSYWANESDKWESGNPALPTEEWKYSWPENETMLGLGFVFNRLHVDCNVNPRLFIEGLNFISGGNEQMNFNFTALYDLH
jgi:hypothetical protein